MLGKAESTMFMEMEENINRLKAFSDILVSVSQSDMLPDAASLNKLAETMLIEADALYNKFTELCNAFHDVDRVEGELPDLYPSEVMELVAQIEDGNKTMIDVVYEAYKMGVSMTAEALKG